MTFEPSSADSQGRRDVATLAIINKVLIVSLTRNDDPTQDVLAQAR